MTGGAIEALVYIIHTLTQLYLFILLVRLIMPWLRATYNNPLAQAILRATSPLVVPLRRVIPPIGRLDTATVLVAFAIQYLTVLTIAALRGFPLDILLVAETAAVKLVVLSIWLFIIAILIRVAMSWIGGGGHNPAMGIVDALSEPVLRPVRRLFPTPGGMDLSPLFVTVFLVAMTILIGSLKFLPI